MKFKNSRWTMVMVGVIALLMVGTMVWASPPVGAPSAPLQAYDAKNADKVDGLHASKRPKALTLLALNKNKKFPASVIPAAITRDKEVMRIVKNNDGAGSGLDADLLDGHDTIYFQQVVTGTCTAGNAIRVVNANGTVTCEADDDTLGGLSCTDDQVAKWDDPTGEWECGSDETGAGGGGDITAITEDGSTPLTFTGCDTGDCSIGMLTDGSGECGAGNACTGGHAHDGRYYTESESDGRFVNVTGDTMTGNLTAPKMLDKNNTSYYVDPNGLSKFYTIEITNDGSGSGIDADALDGLHESSFFRLSQNETVSGRPAFNGGLSGSTPPFYVDSTYRVTYLNADLLDGYNASAFAAAGHNHDAAYINDDQQETISAAVAGTLLTVNNTGTGSNVRGLYAYGEDYGVYGDSSSGYGVYGYGGPYGVRGDGSAYGVGGYSSSGTGVYGYSETSSGVGGYSISAYGVYGSSSSGYGVYGSGSYGVYGLGTSYGVYGYSETSSGVYGSSTSGSGVYGSGSYGVYGYGSSGTGVYGSGGTYGVFSAGDFVATGSKNAVVETKDYGWRHLYAMESPEVWFEDFGQAQLVEGQAVVAIEPIFAQTVNLSETYHVFLTPLGDEPVLLFVTEKRRSGFTVRGVTLDGEPAVGSFDYRIIGKRLGYEEERLEPAEDPSIVAQEMEIQQEGP